MKVSLKAMLLTSVCAVLPLGAVVHAEGKATGHCEKKVKGKVTDLDHADTRAKCKKEGGKWQKGEHKHDHDGAEKAVEGARVQKESEEVNSEE